jgi:hypothetical protein
MASSIICGHRTITIADIADVSSHRMLGTRCCYSTNQLSPRVHDVGKPFWPHIPVVSEQSSKQLMQLCPPAKQPKTHGLHEDTLAVVVVVVLVVVVVVVVVVGGTVVEVVEGGVVVVEGGGKVVVEGGGNVVVEGGGNVVDEGGGNVVVVVVVVEENVEDVIVVEGGTVVVVVVRPIPTGKLTEGSSPNSIPEAIELNAKLPTLLLAAPLKTPPNDAIGPLGPI